MEKKNKKYGDKGILIFMFVFALMNIGILIFWIIFEIKYYIGKIIMFSMIDITAMITMYYAIFYKKGIETNKVVSEYLKYLATRKDEEQDKREKDVLELMFKNNKEIAEYFEISKRQEKFSYIVSIGCAIIGAVILFSSIGVIFFNKGIEITVVTIIGGSITELVSGVVLWIHNKSAMQLNFYYNSLHENEKFLSAINMVDRLKNDGQKDQMYMEIIKAQIRAREENKENGK